MKKLLRISLACFTAGFGPVANAATATDANGITWNYTVNGDHVSLSRQAVPTSTKGDITIPTTLDGKPVTSIGSSAFSDCEQLRTIRLPEGLEALGEDVFDNCSLLESLVIPNSVTNFGSLGWCRNLTNLVIGAGITRLGRYTTTYERYGRTYTTTVGTSDQIAGCENSHGVCMTFLSSDLLIGGYAFYRCTLRSFSFPAGVKVGDRAFSFCTLVSGFEFRLADGSETFGLDYLANASVLKDRIVILVIPNCCRSTSHAALNQLTKLKKVVFEGESLSGADKATITALKSRGVAVVYRPAEGAEQDAEAAYDELQDLRWSLRITSSSMRESDGSVLDVRYVATGVTNRFTVRSLAFKDGLQSFANVIRPRSFVDGTAAKAFGDVTANEEHLISWKISDDWPVSLGRVAFKVMAPQTTELPLDLVSIPATANHRAMRFSCNALTAEQVLEALFWHYADPDCGLTLTDGKLFDGETLLADGAEPTGAGAAYVFAKMGYQLLTGAELEYANSVSRLGLHPRGVSQYAVKYPDN